MEACGQIFKSGQWRWSGGPHGDSAQHRFLSSALNSTLSNHTSVSVPMISSSERAGGFVPTAIAHGVLREGCATHYQIPVVGFQLPNYRHSRAQHQGLKTNGQEKIECQVWSRTGSSPSAGLPRRLSALSSAVASDFVSPDGMSNSTRKEHVEQLEEFYSENEFLFVDETWTTLEKNEECSAGISRLLKEKLSLLLSAGRVQRGSRVLVWGGSAAFVEQLSVTTSPASVVVTHFSMSVLGTVKEMNDDVICWLGNIEDVPDSYGPFDAVFLNSVLATAYCPADLLRGVASLCNPGARIVISCTQGKKDLAECRERNPQLILQNLPDATDLEKMINPLPLILVEIQDEPSFYLATVEVEGTSRAIHTQNGSGEVSGSTSMRFPLRARGHIVQGFGRGSKQMGIPTANIDPDELPREFLALAKGVYFGWAKQHGADELDGGVYKMVLNIGNRPTFADGDELSVETHILHNFSSDFYGQELSIIVSGFLRDEIRFSSPGDLVQRIKADITTAEKLLDEDEMFQHASDGFFIR